MRSVLATLWQVSQRKVTVEPCGEIAVISVNTGAPSCIMMSFNVHEDSPEFIFDILQKVNSPKLKASIDVGHINVYSEIDVENWILKMKDSLIHMHFHNNFGNDDEHNCLTRGTLDFYKIVKCLKNNNLSPLIVFEIFEKQALLESINIFDRLYEKGDLT